jgi:DNA polymerase-3 subunit delta'
MIWDDVRGRADQVEMFRRTIGRGRLASAYLFLGPEGTGKNLFAQRIAQCLFCTTIADEQLDACGTCSGCRQMQAGSHPDFLRVACPEGKREIPIDLFVGSREARGREGLCHDLSIRPMASHRKIAVIDGADLMNEEGANAILKTLEEPPPYALMILVASNPDSLLSTIRSRCQAVRFAALAEQDVADLLVAQGQVTEPHEAAVIAGLSDGSLAIASQLLDPQLRQLRDRLYAGLAAERFASVPLVKQVLAGIEEIGGDAGTQRRHAQWTLRFGMEFYRQVLRRLSEPHQPVDASMIPQAGQLAARLDPGSASDAELVMELFDRMAAASDLIERMTPVPLCLEGLFDDIGRIQRHRKPVRG